MLQRHEPGRLESLLLLALGIGLVLCLFVPQAAGHLALSFLCLTLVPLFLFSALQTVLTSSLSDPDTSSVPAPQTARPALFQIPPPSASA